MPRLTMMNKPYNDKLALPNVVNYVLDTAIYGGVAVDPEHAVEQMMLLKRIWHKTEGRQVRHFFMSFAEWEDVTIDEAVEYGFQIAQYYGQRFQTVFGLHLDTMHTHLHFALNTVSYVDGRMYSEGYVEWENFRQYVQILIPCWEVTLAVKGGDERDL